MRKKYHHTVVGGTFDHLHLGHKKLLATAFENAQLVTIGLSTKALYQDKKMVEAIEDYQIREKQLNLFLSELGVLERATILPLSDIYGTSLTDTTIDVIVVSEETKENAKRINIERQKKNMPPLAIITIPLVRGDDKQIIRSEHIRVGDIDTKGNSYDSLFSQKTDFLLPKKLREELQQPIGTVLTTTEELLTLKNTSSFITSVGDITTLSLFEAGTPPAIAFIDGRTQRQTLDQSLFRNFFSLPQPTLVNEAGLISKDAARVYQEARSRYLKDKTTQILRVSGEEDLLALPAILLAPLSSFVLYGQKGKGIIAVAITEEKKIYAKELLKKFHAQ